MMERRKQENEKGAVIIEASVALPIFYRTELLCRYNTAPVVTISNITDEIAEHTISIDGNELTEGMDYTVNSEGEKVIGRTASP